MLENVENNATEEMGLAIPNPGIATLIHACVKLIAQNFITSNRRFYSQKSEKLNRYKEESLQTTSMEYCNNVIDIRWIFEAKNDLKKVGSIHKNMNNPK